MVNRRRYRRNPAIMGFQVPSIRPVLEVSAGYMGTGALENILTTAADGSTPIIPTTITGNAIGKYAVRIGCAIAVTYLAKLAKLNSQNVGAGAGAYVAISAVKEFAPGWVPGLNAYTPGRGRLNAYTPGNMRGVPTTPMPQLASGRFNRF